MQSDRQTPDPIRSGLKNNGSAGWLWSYRTRLTAVVVAALLTVLGLSHLLIYRSAGEAQFEQLRAQLMTVAQTASLLVDGDALSRIPSSRDGVSTPEFIEISTKLKKVRDMNPSIRYIYTLRRTADPNQLEFVVDLDPEPVSTEHRGGTAYPGDRYDATAFPEMFRGFRGPSADRALAEDAWGVALSGYAPVRDSMGKPVAIIGVDMDAGDVRLAQRNAAKKFVHVMILGVLLSVLIGILLAGGLTRRIVQLTRGVAAVAEGDLSRRAPEEGRDELARLGSAFNRMTLSLSESREKLEAHFCHVIEALVRMLEAKDKYTQGHSERVGVYAKRIALRLGLSEKEAELIRRAGQLHDIGKLAVHDHVLNKVEPLTDEEWEMIRRHPVTGYETLKGIGLDEIILSSIHLHHERPDGAGYPKKLSGEAMGLYPQIVAVADAYDAMTTTRSYRKSMTPEAVLDELKRCSGTQFNPRVIQALLEILADDPRYSKKIAG